MKKQLLLLLGILLALPAAARDFDYTYEGQTITYTVLDEEAKTVETKAGEYGDPGNKVSGNLILPSVVLDGDDEYTLTKIGNSAFYNCVGLTAVVISNSVITIDRDAFNNCNGLRSIEIPNSVTTIGDWAFCDCTGLTSVIIGNSVTTIGSYTFEQCIDLRSIEIPNSVTSMGDGAFCDCTGLTSVVIPNSVTKIGNNAFQNCSSLERIDVKEGNKNYCSVDGVLFNFDKTTLIQFPAGKTGQYKIPNTVTEIDSYAIYRCIGLTSVIIGNSVTSIGDYAFSSCPRLTSVTIPSSVQTIGSYSFSWNALKLVEIKGDRVLTFGYNCFYSSSHIKNIHVPQSVIEDYRTQYPEYKFLPIPNFVYSGEGDGFEIGLNDSRTLSLSLENADLANGFQTDITLPAGLTIAEKDGGLDVYFGENTAAESHVITAAKVDGENKYRIVAYSSKNETFKSGENLLNINIVSDNKHKGGDIVIDNTVMSLTGDISCNPDALTIKVPEFIGVEQIALDPSEASLNLGKTLKLNAEVMPVNAWVQTLTWNSSNAGVATVDAEGVVTPVAKGVAVITATSTDGTAISASASITVTNYMQSLTIGDNITIEGDETMQLNPVFEPATAEQTELVWSSSNKAVAYVDSDNVLHALSAGTATITATNTASGLEASITVTVGAVLYGDANDNGIVAIDDVVTDVEYILEQNPTPFNFKKADVNRDNTINIIDVSKTVSIILTNSPANAPRRAAANVPGMSLPGLSADDVTLSANHKSMTIKLGDMDDITALQGDIEMPEGVTIDNISLAGAQQGDHIVSFARINDRCVRFAVYSLSLAKFSGNAPMLEIELDCNRSFLDQNAEVYDIMASDVRSNLLCFDSFGVNISSGDMTGLEEHLSDNGAVGDVYTIQGICVMRDATQKDIDTLAPGIYIVRQGDKAQKIAIY